MRKSYIILFLLATLSACSSYVSKEELRTADTTLFHADSLENTVYVYADTLALKQAIDVYRRTNRMDKETKTIYHLGKAYIEHHQDSLASLCLRQAAEGFLAQSDSVYYPLTIWELSILAERGNGSGANKTMLHALRSVQREMIRGKEESSLRWSLEWILLLVGLAIASAIIFFFVKRRPAPVYAVTREELERNIELVLSQGSVKVTLNWQDYNRFCGTANAYLYSVVDKLQAKEAQLSEQDIRFCVLVLLDLPAKEIADIMRLSPNSISNKKTRTAQKLGTTAASLQETLITITLNSSKQ